MSNIEKTLLKNERNQYLFNPKELEHLLLEREKLKFHCDNCKHEWTQYRPIGYAVRSGDDTNFFAMIGNENSSIRVPVKCPECRKTTKIRRMAVAKICSQPQRPATVRREKDGFDAIFEGSSETTTY